MGVLEGREGRASLSARPSEFAGRGITKAMDDMPAIDDLHVLSRITISVDTILHDFWLTTTIKPTVYC